MRRLIFILAFSWCAVAFGFGEDDEGGFGDDWGMDDKMPPPPPPMPGGANGQLPGAPQAMLPGSLPPNLQTEPPPPPPEHSYGGAGGFSGGETSKGAVQFRLTGEKRGIEKPKTWKEKISGPRWHTPDPQTRTEY